MDSPQSDTARWFAQEVQPHDSHLKAFLRGSFPAVRDVDDVVQESYVRLCRVRTVAPIQSAKAFLFLIARRVALNVLRKDRNAPFVNDDAAMSQAMDDQPDALATLLARERIELLADALMALPPRCREVVVLHKVKGMPQQDVASLLGLSERTVESHIRAGVSRCRAYLCDHGCKTMQDHEP